MRQRDVADLSAGPQGDLRVAVLTRHVRVDILSGHARLTRHEVTQARRVEHRARAEDLVAGQARELQSHVGDDVDGVRDEHEAGIRSHILQVRHDLLHQVHGRTGQLQAGLPGLLLGSSRDDDQVGATNDLNVIRAFDRAGGRELDAVGHVEGLGLHLCLVDVLKNDRTGVAAHRAGVRDGRTDGTGTDDGDLGGTSGGL